MRGGANGARIRLSPQNEWDVNKPDQLSNVLKKLEVIGSKFGASLADTIVLAGVVGVEMSCDLKVPFQPGRGDATEDQTDSESFDVLEPLACGFRNYSKTEFIVSPEEMMLDRAHLLNLTSVEMTVLVGGLRTIGISATGEGIWTQVGKLSNEWFKKLLDMDVKWETTGSNSYEGKSRSTGKVVRTASRTDLVFGSNSELRAIAEVYAQNDNNDKFVSDFISAWTKVMDADMF